MPAHSRLPRFVLVLALFVLPTLSLAQPPNTPTAAPSKDTVLFDFDGGNYNGWTLTGDCWDKQPATAKTFVDKQGHSLVLGIVGTGFLISQYKNPAAMGNTVSQFLEQNKIPGCAVVITDNGRIVYSRGYGLAETETQQEFRPTTNCSVASVSKTIIGAAVVKLLETGRLHFQDQALPILVNKGILKKFGINDERYGAITVADLLHHESGLGNEHALFSTLSLRQEAELASPPTSAQLLQLCLRKPLNAEPGTKYS